MGGGDLNLKKSWHPHTMKNQEKVWKAEQAKSAEDRKMNDLRKEIMEEKNRDELIKIGQASGVLNKSDDKKLEWMYKSATELVSREEYLLGRPIDKTFEMMEEEEKRKNGGDMVGVKVSANHVEHECIPFSIRAYRNTASTEQVDLQRKILEDPLMIIKQREMDSRRKILENPVKLKELHRILKTEKTKEKSKSSSHSKKKKSKKSKKRRTSDSDDSDHSDKDLDEMLQKQYKKLKGKKEQLAGLDLSKLMDAKYETISKELDKAAQSKKKKEKSKKSSKKHNSSSTDSESDSDSDNKDRRIDRDRSTHGTYRERNRSPVDRRDQRNRNQYHNFGRRNWYPKDNYRNGDRKRSRSISPENRYNSRRRSRSPAKSNYHDKASTRNEDHKPATNSKTGGLTEEEKEKRLKDMMDNAAWRDKERTRYVEDYREKYRKEEEQNKAKEFDKQFINIQLKKAMAHQTSMESRIKSKVNSIQRTRAAMDANFVRK